MLGSVARHARLVGLLGVALFAVVAGIAYAAIPDSRGLYTACMLNNVGTVRLIDPALPASNPMSHCSSLETRITFNQQGQQGPAGAPGKDGSPGADGKDGQSVSTQPESPGGNCANGGASFTAVNGTSYACNGAPGVPGKDGTNGADGVSPTVTSLAAGDTHCRAGGAAITDAQGNQAYACNGANGTDGQPFSGTFTSPNGEFSISVADSGITLAGPAGSIKLLATGQFELRANQQLNLRAGSQLDVQAGSQLDLSAATQLNLRGAALNLNCPLGCLPAARQSDPVSNNQIAAGSGSVFIGP